MRDSDLDRRAIAVILLMPYGFVSNGRCLCLQKDQMTELWTLTASELAPMVAARQISVKEAVSSVLERIEAVNPALNAIV